MVQAQFMAPWVPVFNAAVEAEASARDHKPPFTTFYFATVDRNGYPRNRTLVHRGYLFDNKSNNTLIFCTDKRMDKYTELIHNDKFEAVYYFEKIRKQFRFSGRARIIDSQHYPSLDIASIQPKNIINSNLVSQSSSDTDSDSDEENLQISVVSSRLSANNAPSNTETPPPQQAPIDFPIVSPLLLLQLQEENTNLTISYPNLQELSSVEFVPPTKEDWDAELIRSWNSLSKGLKLSFRRPVPKSLLDEKKQNQIDKISRGVDGKKEDSGLENFAVVALFIESADYYEMEKDRRYIYEKESDHTWSEHEVCP